MNAYKKLESLNDRCKYLFNIIQKDGPITKNELIKKTNMKLTTLNRDVQILINNKIVVETAIAESTGGRKPSLYDINPYEFYSVGIDISRTYIEIVITNLKIKIVAEKKLKDLCNIAENIPNCINALLKKAQIDKASIVGMGIGIVGGFDIAMLKDKLIQEFQIPIYIDNGANAAAIGEYYFGLGKDKQNIAYINCGVGIRTGVISSGILISTINNSEDAFAHMIVDPQGEQCLCGNYGCVESYASISKITQKFIEEVKNQGKEYLNKELDQMDYQYVCSLAESLAESKNNIARALIMNAALHFGIGLANYIRLFNPQLIILSGPLIQYSQLFYDECNKNAVEKCHIKDNSIIFNRGGYFKNKSMSVGASVMAIQRLTNSKE